MNPKWAPGDRVRPGHVLADAHVSLIAPVTLVHFVAYERTQGLLVFPLQVRP